MTRQQTEDKQAQIQNYQMQIKTEDYHVKKLEEMTIKNEDAEDTVMLGCRHVYIAHQIKLYQIQNDVEQEWATGEQSLDVPSDLLNTL